MALLFRLDERYLAFVLVGGIVMGMILGTDIVVGRV